MAATTDKQVTDLANNLADLDFNVTDEEINNALNIWKDSTETDLLGTTQINYPMYVSFISIRTRTRWTPAILSSYFLLLKVFRKLVKKTF